MRKTAVIILNYNNPTDTINCVESVRQCNTALVRIVVVDNGSTLPGCVSDIDAYLSKSYGDNYCRMSDKDDFEGGLSDVTFLVSQKNDGYARGNNKGILLATKDESIEYLLILNNDVLFIEDIIPGLMQSMDSLDDCGIIGPLLFKKNCEGIDWNCARLATPLSQWTRNNFLAPFHWLARMSAEDIYRDRLILRDMPEPYPEIVPIELPSGSCMFVKKRFFNKIGNFDPNTFLYSEENILYRKIKDAGQRNYIDTRLRCIHLGASTISRRQSSAIVKAGRDSQNYYIKNYLKPSALSYSLFKASEAWVRVMESLKNIVKPNQKAEI